MMFNRRSIRLSAIVGGLLIAGVAAGQAGQGPAERLGEKLDGAGRAVKQGVRDVAQEVREGFAKTRTSVHNMGIEARVYGRLHWDKDLTGALIELQTGADGVVSLRGSVADANAKQKAVALARETVGVTRVIDQLAIAPTGSTTTTITTERRTTTETDVARPKP